MMCSREVKTTLPMATMPSLRMASRFAANAWGPDLPVRHDEIRIAHVQLIDFVLGDELVDFDGAPAFDGYRFQLFGLQLDVLPLADLVALDDIPGLDFLAGVGIDLAVFDAVSGIFVELVEADLFPFRSRREQRNRARD